MANNFKNANEHLKSKQYIEAINCFCEMLNLDIGKDIFIEKQINKNIEYSFRKIIPYTLKFKKTIPSKLIKNNQVEFIEIDKCWYSIGVDPNFTVKFPQGYFSPTGGWYRLILKIELINQKKSSNFSKLYFSFEENHALSEQNSFGLNYDDACEFVSRVFFLKEEPTYLRFDPTENEGNFRIHLFQIQEIDEQVARKQMLDEIQFHRLTSRSKSSFLSEKSFNEDKDTYTYTDTYLENIESEYNYIHQKNNNSYSYWIENVEVHDLSVSEEDIIELTEASPTINVACIVEEKSDFEFILESVQSIVNQSYKKWTLSLFIKTNELSTEDALKLKELSELTEKDSRIDLMIESKKNHSSILNELLNKFEKQKNGFFALLETKNLITQNAFHFIAKTIEETPQVKILYGDEDCIHPITKERYNPIFKSDWNIDLIYSQNYTLGFNIYKITLIDEAGGFSQSYHKCQNYDLILRCSEYVNSKEVIHIPKILHRNIEESTLCTQADKEHEISNLELESLRAFFIKKDPTVTVEHGMAPKTYRVRRTIKGSEPLVSILIPTKDCHKLLKLAISSILDKTTYKNYEIIILNNDSKEEETYKLFEYFKKHDSRIRIIDYNLPFNYSAINNFGVSHAKGDLICLLNNDVEIISNEWLTEMCSQAIRPEIGCVGAKLFYSNDTVQHAGVILGIAGVAGHIYKHLPRTFLGYKNGLACIQNYLAVTAACLVVKKSIFQAVGGLNEKYLAIAYNDVDLCLKIYSAGYRNLWTPYAELYHYESVSRGSDATSPEKIRRLYSESEYMLQNWAHLINMDPYYNINLTKKNENYHLCESFSKNLSFTDKIRFLWEEKEPSYKKENLCIFVNFDKKSKLHKYVINYLIDLRENFDIIFVSTSEQLGEDHKAIEKLKSITKKIIIRENEGYDFGSWRLGLESIKDEIHNYENLLLCNDSVYGPIYKTNEMLDFFKKSDLDIMGATSSFEVQYHIQSFFVLYNRKTFLSKTFERLWNSIRHHKDKWEIVNNYEIGFSQTFINLGYKVGAYCSAENYPLVNIAHVFWKDLIKKNRFPFIKIELLRDNPTGVDISDWREVIKKNSNYDINLIDAHLNSSTL